VTAEHMATDRHSRNERAVITGSELLFSPTISRYAYLLSCALKDESNVGVLLGRRLALRRFYPDRDQAGAAVTCALGCPPDGAVHDGAARRFGRSLTSALIGELHEARRSRSRPSALRTGSRRVARREGGW
jgi:hypothetical protein